MTVQTPIDSATESGRHRRLCREFASSEAGATAIEYALIAAGIGAAIASTVWGLGTSLKVNFYDKIANLF